MVVASRQLVGNIARNLVCAAGWWILALERHSVQQGARVWVLLIARPAPKSSVIHRLQKEFRRVRAGWK